MRLLKFFHYKRIILVKTVFKCMFVVAVVKVADDVRGHSTDSLIHKDHVGVVTGSLIHFVVTDSR